MDMVGATAVFTKDRCDEGEMAFAVRTPMRTILLKADTSACRAWMEKVDEICGNALNYTPMRVSSAIGAFHAPFDARQRSAANPHSVCLVYRNTELSSDCNVAGSPEDTVEGAEPSSWLEFMQVRSDSLTHTLNSARNAELGAYGPCEHSARPPTTRTTESWWRKSSPLQGRAHWRRPGTGAQGCRRCRPGSRITRARR